MIIGPLDLSARALIVAEIGNNHEGKIETARKMVVCAAECGVDAVKFQTFKTESFTSRSDSARFQRLKSFELSFAEFEELAALARAHKLLFVSTPLDLESARFLSEIVDAFKIASGDNNFWRLIDTVIESRKPFIVSTGASDEARVDSLVRYLRDHGLENFALLHCVSSYPAPPEQAHLLAIPFLAQRYPGIDIGYSDHVVGIEASVCAAALGARIIEKHFTLDKSASDFRDHQLSADPREMKDLVRQVRTADEMRGDWGKDIQPCEHDIENFIRRSICAARDLAAGHVIAFTDLAWLRPAGGLSPDEEKLVIGRKLRHAVAAGTRLDPADVD